MSFAKSLISIALLAVSINAEAVALPWANANPQAKAAASAYASAYAEAEAIGHADPNAYALAASADDCATIACHATCGLLIMAGQACAINGGYTGPYNKDCLCADGGDFKKQYPSCMECGWTLWKYYGGYVSEALAVCGLSTEPTGTLRCSTTLTDEYTIDTNIQGCEYLGNCPTTTTSGQQQPTTTTPGQQEPTTTTPGQQEPTITTPGQQEPTTTTPGQQGPTTTTSAGDNNNNNKNTQSEATTSSKGEKETGAPNQQTTTSNQGEKTTVSGGDSKGTTTSKPIGHGPYVNTTSTFTEEDGKTVIETITKCDEDKCSTITTTHGAVSSTLKTVVETITKCDGDKCSTLTSTHGGAGSSTLKTVHDTITKCEGDKCSTVTQTSVPEKSTVAVISTFQGSGARVILGSSIFGLALSFFLL